MSSYDPLSGTHGLVSRRSRERRIELAEPPPEPAAPEPQVEVRLAPTADAITPDIRYRILAVGEVEERRMPATTAVALLVGLSALLWLAFDQFAAAGGLSIRWPLSS